MSLYQSKSDDYFSHARREIEPLLKLKKNQSNRVLEIGCGSGHTLHWLKASGYVDWVAGVEPYADHHNNFDNFDVFEKINIEEQLPDIAEASLDLILCLDVLEHLNNPWAIIKALNKLLKPGGQWIVSVPNVRNYRILARLFFKGEFEYTDAGILDRTHIRFFTRKSLIDLIESTNSTVNEVFLPETQKAQKRLLCSLGLGDLIAKQLIVSATKK